MTNFSTEATPAVRMLGIRKAYGSCISNADVNLEVSRGTIHGILGENGAGKSTAMKILYGMVAADAGEIWIDGKKCHMRSPLEAKALGIGMVHQHFMLSEAHSVLENIILGMEPLYPSLGWLPEALQPLAMRTAREKLERLMNEHGLEVPLDASVDSLSVGTLQRVEILKLLYQETRILILDEPTAVLTPQEVDRFFIQLKHLAATGKTILIVTHKLRELLAVTDSISIFRAGSVIASVATSSIDADALAALMIGKKLDPVQNNSKQLREGKPLLSIQNWPLKKTRNPSFQHETFSLELHAGEILGIAGIEGNGQQELVELLRHPKQAPPAGTAARLELLGRDVTSWSAIQMTAAGVGYIPADRHKEAILLDQSATRNFVLGYQDHPSFRFGPFLRWGAIHQATVNGMKLFEVSPLQPDLPIKRFSGGNQQKIVVARALQHQPRLLIAVHPTRGVDVGAIQLIHKKLLELRSQGLAILLISSELDEILALADRILVMENYRVAARFTGNACNETALGLAMSGADSKKEKQHG